MEPPTVVIDNGTGYSKMGYAGNLDPSYIIPSTIATSLAKVSCIWVILADSRMFFDRNHQANWTTQILITTLATRPLPILSLTSWATFSSPDRLRIGKVLKSSGTSPCTRICAASQRSTGSSWRSRQWTRQRTESKLLRSCSRRSASRVSSLVFRPLWPCSVRCAVPRAKLH